MGPKDEAASSGRLRMMMISVLWPFFEPLCVWSSFFLDDSAPGAQKKSEMSRRLPNVRRLRGLFCVEKNESQKPRTAMTEKGALR